MGELVRVSISLYRALFLSLVFIGLSLACRPAIASELRQRETPIYSSPGAFPLESLGLLPLDGAISPLETLQDKRLVLYFWSIYCHSCVDFLQELSQNKASFTSENTVILAVHLFEKDQQKITDFLEERGIDVEVVTASEQVRDTLKLRSLPAVVTIENRQAMAVKVAGPLSIQSLLRSKLAAKR